MSQQQLKQAKAAANPFPNAKSITPISIGFPIPRQAVKINVTSTSDNLSTQAVFGYTLIDSKNSIVFTGSEVMGGQDYINWPGDNNTPFTYVASKIGVTLH